MLLKTFVLLLTINFITPSLSNVIMTDAQKFPIVEETPLEVLEKKLQEAQQSGRLEALQKEIVARVQKTLLSPPAVAGIGKSQQPRSWVFDPSFTVSQDLRDHKGQVFAAKGQRLNPLETTSFGDPFLFIDGEDDEQVMWATSQPGDIVLVKGSPTQVSEKVGRPIFFDQGGRLTKKFSIQNVPATVRQKERVLVVEEVVL